MKKTFFIPLLCLALTASAQRSERLLEKGWRFTRTDNAEAAKPDFNDKKWQNVSVPHDWAIYGPFSFNNDKQKIAIAQDGQKEAMEHAGRTGGLPFVGIGWYRLRLTVPEYTKGKRVSLLFDGAMNHPQVYLNGQKVGEWAYGYNSFSVDITPYIIEGKENLLAVRLENKNESSRWYPGAGLYRNVHLLVTDEAHIPLWGTQITTSDLSVKQATVSIKTPFVLPQGAEADAYKVKTEIFSAEGQLLKTDLAPLSGAGMKRFTLENPLWWSPESPYLYTAVTTILKENQVCDRVSLRFGIRSLEIVPDKGFVLNGKVVKFRGVCNHHDLGPLGTAVNKTAICRQIRILKEMGCNAIRTSHNMPAPELVEACDEMGMMLMCESFDEWKAAKVGNGYHLDFDKWAEKDLVNLVRHYRNNASVVMWCIGNEVPDQWNGNRGPKLSRFLQDICHREDPTRPVTQGMDAPDAVVNNNMAAVMDVPGFNYRPSKYQINYDKLPQQVILGSETASTISSRGVYKFPVERAAMRKYDDHQASSYDVEHCGWSNLPEDDWIWHEDKPWCMGEFVWTGFDYLGEPTPYYSDWPSHSSLFGIVDLAGIPKDRYYLYRSHWNPTAPTLHLLPHWTFPGREGQVTPVFVYTNASRAELFINGKSQGIQTKDTTVTIDNSADAASEKSLKRQSRYRLMWKNVTYEPGELRVVAYDANGKAVAEETVRTAGKPYRLVAELEPSNTFVADGKDLAYIRVKAVDKEGNLCPTAHELVHFKVTGEGTFCAAANGDAACLDLFHLPQMHLFSGQLTAIVRSTEKAGAIRLQVSAKGLQSSFIQLKSK
ncbi:MAG: DUF4982 domain-containing protein [Bacteroidaceae bacterium]